ncbi:hypothetical protein BHE74_00039095 [Ensete ventricosum]|uniref:Uncharacterized protein n=1 Tax=Ensete ventricosum TaxID=4639 RepID=A0A445M935_ENSVE|nr:hypothetical protein BHE74_00039095 [Ensete ventricosum]RZR70747.1 hypothetical protein BHM03_00001259 [Ensete ventricosum]
MRSWATSLLTSSSDYTSCDVVPYNLGRPGYSLLLCVSPRCHVSSSPPLPVTVGTPHDTTTSSLAVAALATAATFNHTPATAPPYCHLATTAAPPCCQHLQQEGTPPLPLKLLPYLLVAATASSHANSFCNNRCPSPNANSCP